MTVSSSYSWVKFMVTTDTDRRLDNAIFRDNLDRGEWLQLALRDALEKSEQGYRGKEEA